MINKKALVLNIDFTPLMVISWQRAITSNMLHQDVPELGLEVVEYYDEVVYSAGGRPFPIPCVMKTTRYVKKRKKVPLKKRNVYSRDKYKCGYCGKELTDKNITLDHIVSRHEWRVKRLKGNVHQWTNLISSCKSCNFKKGSLPLAKSGLKLIKQPVEPSYNEYLRQALGNINTPEQWKVYLNVH